MAFWPSGDEKAQLQWVRSVNRINLHFNNNHFWLTIDHLKSWEEFRNLLFALTETSIPFEPKPYYFPGQTIEGSTWKHPLEELGAFETESKMFHKPWEALKTMAFQLLYRSSYHQQVTRYRLEKTLKQIKREDIVLKLYEYDLSRTHWFVENKTQIELPSSKLTSGE